MRMPLSCGNCGLDGHTTQKCLKRHTSHEERRAVTDDELRATKEVAFILSRTRKHRWPRVLADALRVAVHEEATAEFKQMRAEYEREVGSVVSIDGARASHKQGGR